MVLGTYKTANDKRRIPLLKGGHMLGCDLDDGQGAEDSNEGPEDGSQIANVAKLLLAMSEEMRDGPRDVVPGRARDDSVEIAIDIEAPRPGVHGWLMARGWVGVCSYLAATLSGDQSTTTRQHHGVISTWRM